MKAARKVSVLTLGRSIARAGFVQVPPGPESSTLEEQRDRDWKTLEICHEGLDMSTDNPECRGNSRSDRGVVFHDPSASLSRAFAAALRPWRHFAAPRGGGPVGAQVPRRKGWRDLYPYLFVESQEATSGEVCAVTTSITP
jgi:hypothetical protein